MLNELPGSTNEFPFVVVSTPWEVARGGKLVCVSGRGLSLPNARHVFAARIRPFLPTTLPLPAAGFSLTFGRPSSQPGTSIFEKNCVQPAETRWQRFGQFLDEFLNDFLCENLDFLYENLNFLHENFRLCL